MKFPNKEIVERLRRQYPKGTRSFQRLILISIFLRFWIMPHYRRQAYGWEVMICPGCLAALSISSQV